MDTIPYDLFTGAFLSKITEFDFAGMNDYERNNTIDSYMKRAISDFRSICPYDFLKHADDNLREFQIAVPDDDIDEIADIVSEGMLTQWLKPYVYKQENLESVLNTRDYSTYSPAELLHRIGESYQKAQRDFTNKMRDYSYTHGDLTDLHL